ncbi:MAG: hypothetical protein ACXWV0_09630 [Flavisolibacter sp.]
MKKLFLFAALLPLLSFTLVEWINLKIDDRMSIDFPSQPTEKEMSGNPIWVADVDNNSRVMVMTMDFKNLGMDSAMLSDELTKPGSFEGFGQGVLQQMPGAKLLAEDSTRTQGYLTFNYKIDMGKDTNELNIMYCKSIFINTTMYAIYFYEKEGGATEATRKSYFNSIRISKW